MQIALDPTWLIGFLLAFVRSAAWLAVVPPFSSLQSVPRTVIVGIAGGFAILSAPLVVAAGVPTTTPALIGAIVMQILAGVALGFVVRILVATIGSAGSMVDLLGGINPPPAMDPLSQNQLPLVWQLYDQVAILSLFVSNGELMLVRGFESSFATRSITAGGGGLLANVLVADLATFFTASLEIAAPIMAVLFCTQIALALLAKAAPQLNAWWLGMPLQILLALVMSAFAIRVVPGYLTQLVNRALQDGHLLLGLH
jgi:flagellar biosynthetic protein FliR